MARIKLEDWLVNYDHQAFDDRLQRLRHLYRIFPDHTEEYSSIETSYIFNEVKMAYVNGEFISTIFLSQAYIERKLQSYYISLGLNNIAKTGLRKILEHGRQHKTLSLLLVERITILRQKRNPIAHLKKTDHNFAVAKRLIDSNRATELNEINALLEEDARESISLMYHVSSAKLKK